MEILSGNCIVYLFMFFFGCFDSVTIVQKIQKSIRISLSSLQTERHGSPMNSTNWTHNSQNSLLGTSNVGRLAALKFVFMEALTINQIHKVGDKRWYIDVLFTLLPDMWFHGRLCGHSRNLVDWVRLRTDL